MAFVRFLGFRGPNCDRLGVPFPGSVDESFRLLQVTVPDVQAFRDHFRNDWRATSKTVSRRISSGSGFYKFMLEATAEGRLPINVPNLVHAQFVTRDGHDPVDPTEALMTPAQARTLFGLPSNDSLVAVRARATLRFDLYTGARLATGCRLQVSDLRLDDEDARVAIQRKSRGCSKRVIGVHFALAESLQLYVAWAGIASDPFFRA